MLLLEPQYAPGGRVLGGFQGGGRTGQGRAEQGRAGHGTVASVGHVIGSVVSLGVSGCAREGYTIIYFFFIYFYISTFILISNLAVPSRWKPVKADAIESTDQKPNVA